MQSLMNEWGLEGYAAYFILMEMCGKKLERRKDEPLTDDHFRFVFNERLLREKLRMRSHKLCEFLSSCIKLGLFDASWNMNRSSTEVPLKFNFSSTLVQLPSTKDEYEFSFYVPKLLECLDRDSKRPRSDRAPTAPKKKSKIKKESIADWQSEAFALLIDGYKKTFPGTDAGANAEPRFLEQATSPEIAAQMFNAVEHYKSYLSSLKWPREPKTSVSTFLGTKKSGYFWRDYIEPKQILQATGSECGFSDV